jgi:hypothetical protein
LETIKVKDFLQAVITMREYQRLRAKGQCTQEICSRNEAKVDSMISKITENKPKDERSLF